jgi:hypothetical protein
VIRSGSTWSFNVCRALFQEYAIRQKVPFGSAYLDGPYVDQFIAREWSLAPGPTVIKNHMIGATALAAIRSGQAKAVCTYRDPRDCIASDLVFMNGGMEFSLKRVSASLGFLKYYQSSSQILLVKYEQMMSDRLGEIRRIARHLGLEMDEAFLRQVDSKTNIDSSQKLCRELQNRPSDQVLNIASHRVDPQTHLHENHIGRAKPGRWKEDFSLQQGRWLTEYFSTYLVQLGYETPQSIQEYLTGGGVDSSAQTAESFPLGTETGVRQRQGIFSVGLGLMQNQAG